VQHVDPLAVAVDDRPEAALAQLTEQLLTATDFELLPRLLPVADECILSLEGRFIRLPPPEWVGNQL
jgi:hypothetical protein